MSCNFSWDRMPINQYNISDFDETVRVNRLHAVSVLEETLDRTTLASPTKVYDFNQELELLMHGSGAFKKVSGDVDVEDQDLQQKTLFYSPCIPAAARDDDSSNTYQSFNRSPSSDSSYECSRSDSCTSIDSAYSPTMSSAVPVTTTIGRQTPPVSHGVQSDIEYIDGNAFSQAQSVRDCYLKQLDGTGESQRIATEEITVTTETCDDNLDKNMPQFRVCEMPPNNSTTRIAMIDDSNSYPDLLDAVEFGSFEERASSFQSEFAYFSRSSHTVLTEDHVGTPLEDDFRHNSGLSSTEWGALFSPVSTTPSMNRDQKINLMDPIDFRPRPRSYQYGGAAQYQQVAEREAAKKAFRKSFAGIIRKETNWSTPSAPPPLGPPNLAVITDIPYGSTNNGSNISPLTPKKVGKIRNKRQSPCYILDTRAPDSLGFVNYDARDGSMLMAAVAPSGNNRRRPGRRISSA